MRLKKLGGDLAEFVKKTQHIICGRDMKRLYGLTVMSTEVNIFHGKYMLKMEIWRFLEVKLRKITVFIKFAMIL